MAKRIPKDAATGLFRELARSGHLPLLLDVLRDHCDVLTQRLHAALGEELLTDKKQLAKFQARQGALTELHRLIRSFATLGGRSPATDEPLDRIPVD